MLKKISLMLSTALILSISSVAANTVDFKYIDVYQNNKLLTAYQWQLGSSCTSTDICHMYAEADMFKLGAGVFPKTLIPRYPAHNGCDCTLGVLSIYEVSSSDKYQQIDQAGNTWLRQQSPAAVQQLFSGTDYQIWQDTALWQPSMRHWHGLAAPEANNSLLLAMELNLKLPNDEFLAELAALQNSKYTADKQGADRYYDDSSEPIWPSNKGFRGKPTVYTLQPDTVVDKLGSRPRGNFLAPPTVSRSERAVPNHGKYLEVYQTLHTFKTTAPVRVYAGTIAPWFGEVGLGVQYYLPAGIGNTTSLRLIDSSKLYLQIDQAS